MNAVGFLVGARKGKENDMKRFLIGVFVGMLLVVVGVACTWWVAGSRDIKVRIRIAPAVEDAVYDDIALATVYQTTDPTETDVMVMQIVGTVMVASPDALDAEGNPLEYVITVPRSLVSEKTDYWHCFTVSDFAGNESETPSPMTEESAQADWTAPGRPGFAPTYE